MGLEYAALSCWFVPLFHGIFEYITIHFLQYHWIRSFSFLFPSTSLSIVTLKSYVVAPRYPRKLFLKSKPFASSAVPTTLTMSISFLFTLIVTSALCVLSASAELQRFPHSSKHGASLSFLVVGDWGRGGSYNQSQVAFQVSLYVSSSETFRCCIII